jgi:hypothetical protein
MQNKTIKIRYIRSNRLQIPNGEGYTLIPHDTAQLRALGMNVQADRLDSYPHFPYDAEYIPDVSIYLTHDFYFEFEYVKRDDDTEISDNIWRLISGPNIQSIYHDKSENGKDEYNFRFVLLEQLNEGMSEIEKGRYLII